MFNTILEKVVEYGLLITLLFLFILPNRFYEDSKQVDNLICNETVECSMMSKEYLSFIIKFYSGLINND